MKRLAITLLLFTQALIAQTSTVTATITDPDGQPWNSGSYTINFIPTPGIPGPFTWQGVSNFPQQYTGLLSVSGVLNQAIPDNAFVAPLGSKWQFTLCPNSSAPCQNVVLSVTGAAPNLSTALSSALVAPRFGPGQFAFGYLDVEVIGPFLPGVTYFNVSTQVQRIWNGSSWINNGGGGGGSGTVATGTAGCIGWYALTGTTISPQCNETFSGANAAFLGNLSTGASPPTACGSAVDCVAFNQGSTAGTPTASQNYFRATASGWVCSVGGSAEAACVNAGSIPPPANPQSGDTLLYNINGDSAWDAGSPGKAITTFFSFLNTTLYYYGASNAGAGSPNQLASSITPINPNATDDNGGTLNSASTASLNTVVGIKQGTGINFGEYGFGGMRRWTIRMKPTQSTNARYWMGLTVFYTSGSGGETADPFGTASFATNTINRSTIAFRYSGGTDTNWQAVTMTTGGSQSTVDTGFAVDTTNAHRFDIAYNAGTATFFIDGVQKASITTNTPAPTVFRTVQFIVGDNENTANVVSFDFYWMQLVLR